MVPSFHKLQEETRMWHWEVISMKRWEGMFVIITGARKSSLILITSPSTAPQISVLSTGTLGRQGFGWEYIPSAFLGKALQCMEVQMSCECVSWKGKYGHLFSQAVLCKKEWAWVLPKVDCVWDLAFPKSCSSIHIISMQGGFEHRHCESIFHFKCRTRWREGYLRVMASKKKKQF